VPVVVIGGSRLVGRHAVAAFVKTSPQVRAYVGRPELANELRSVGTKVSVGETLDEDQLEAVMSGAHTVCYLGSDIDGVGEEAGLSTVLASMETIVQAATAAGVQRVLYVSHPRASPDAENAWLRALGLAERRLQSSGLEHVIVRCTRIYGPGLRWPFVFPSKFAVVRVAVVLGNGRQVLAPVFFQDVVDVLVRADDRDRVASGVWGLQGLDRLTMDQLCDLVAGRAWRKLHLKPKSAYRLAKLLGNRPSLAACELGAADSISDAPDAGAEFGVTITPLEEGLRRSVPA
jgi:uncharacterized protein YbjT (DUF2867 family)